MKEMTSYSNEYGKQTELTPEELAWFHSAVDRARRATGCPESVDIVAYDHDLYLGKSKDALGCCCSTDTKNPMAGDPFIAIDNWFIHEMYEVVFKGWFNLNGGETLESVLAHEIAHLSVWRHGKKHTALTEHYLELIMSEAMAA
jgi:Zn-dependent protease with chaperone function